MDKTYQEEAKLSTLRGTLQMLKADEGRVKNVIDRFDAEIVKSNDETLIKTLTAKTKPFRDRLTALLAQIPSIEAQIAKQIEEVANAST